MARQGKRLWPCYPSLSRPLTIMGVERTWFILSATLALALWNALNAIVTAMVVFGALWGAGYLAWKQDPNMLCDPQGVDPFQDTLRPRQVDRRAVARDRERTV